MGIRIFFLLSLPLVLWSCSTDEERFSAISVEKENFIVSSIQAGDRNRIYCIGSTLDSDSSIVLAYDERLNQLNKTYVNRFPAFQGNLKLTKLKDGWLVLEYILQPTHQVDAFVTDDMFNVTSKRTIHNSAVGSLSGKQTHNGGFLITMDTVPKGANQAHSDGIKIIKLNTALGEEFVFTGRNFSNKSTNIYGMHAYELTDETIFYCYAADSVYFGNSYIVAGKLSSDGAVQYQKPNITKRRFIDPISLSYNGQSFVLCTINGVERQVTYSLLNQTDASLVRESSLPFSYRNHQRNKIWPGLGYNVNSEANPLPMNLKSKFGHLVYFKDSKELNYIEVDNQADFSIGFKPTLPELEEIHAYRQYFISERQVVVGLSYQYQGEINFNLQIVDL